MNREDEICLTLQSLINGVDYETGEIVKFSDTVKNSLKVIAATFDCRERCQQISNIPESEQSKVNDWKLVSGTFKEIIRTIKIDRPNHLVIIQNGYFYEALDEDAAFFVDRFSYNTFDWRGVTKTGFPIHSEKVFSDLREMNQPFVLVSQLPKGEGEKVRRTISDVYDGYDSSTDVMTTNNNPSNYSNDNENDDEIDIEQELRDTIGRGFIHTVKHKPEVDNFQSKYKRLEREQKQIKSRRRERVKEAQRRSNSRKKVNISTKIDHKRYIKDTWGSRDEWRTMSGRQSAINKSNKS